MGQKFKKMGIRASHTAEVVFTDVRVPGHCLLGGKEKLDARLARAREGKSSRVQAAMSTFEASRPLVGAQALGIARAAYEYALEYAKQRVAFGRPIIMNQAIAFKLADMKMTIDAARLLVWRACWMSATHKQFTSGEGSMSKLYAGEVALKVTEEAIQILGGAGYVKEHPVEQWHRDSKIYTIFAACPICSLVVCARRVYVIAVAAHSRPQIRNIGDHKARSHRAVWVSGPDAPEAICCTSPMIPNVARSTMNVASGHSVQRTSHTGSQRRGRTVASANKTPATASTTLTASATTNHVGAVCDRTLSIISCASGAMDQRAVPPNTQ
jgi:hypothetical protein